MSGHLDDWVSRSEIRPIVQNKQDFLPFDVEIHCMTEECNIVPKPQTSSRNSNIRAESNNQLRVEEWHDKEWGTMRRMDDELRNTILALCGS